MTFLKLPFAYKDFSFLLMIAGVITFIFVLIPETYAQARVISALLKPDTLATQQGIDNPNGSSPDTLDLVPLKSAKSGSLAMLFSAILPGAGQVYAHRYYTIPIIWGFSGYYISQWIKANDTYMNYRNQFAASILADTAKHQGNEKVREMRDKYRNFRDAFAVYFAITYLLNIIDAYVGATLYNFDVSDNLGNTTATIRFRIPFH